MSLEHLQARLGSTKFNALDWGLAALVARLAGSESPELMLATLLASSQSAAQHACADLALFAGTPVDAELGDKSPSFPNLAPWLEALAAEPDAIASLTSANSDSLEPRPLVLSGTRLYLARYWHYERELAQGLRSRLASLPLDSDTALQGLNQLFGAAQTSPPDEFGCDWQRVAAANALASRFCVISGGPGTGKTTTVAKLLVLLLSAEPELRIALAAPTGKAAARLREAIKRSLDAMSFLAEGLRSRLRDLPALTLHRLLGARWGSVNFRHDRQHPLPYDLVLVDEASMIDLALMTKLVWAVPPQARLILLGDKDQLASVEAGCVLGDLCALADGAAFGPERAALLAQLAPGNFRPAGSALDDAVVLLRHSYRFAAGGGIGRLAREIQAGDSRAALGLLADESLTDIVCRPLPLPLQLPEQLGETLEQGFAAYLQASDPASALLAWERFMVLAALRGGPYGVESLNALIERWLARRGLIQCREAWYHRRPVLISANDEALQLFNGDIGVVWRAEQQTRVWFLRPDGSLRDLSPARLGRHESAWAMTIHKSQGSEFERILMILPDSDSPLLTRELIYTGLTRARRQAEILAPAELLATAIERRIQRSSGLGELLKA